MNRRRVVNYIVRAVHLWHFSVLSLIRSTVQLKATLDGRLGNEIAGMSAYQARNRLILVVLPFSTAIVIFCVQCLRFAWPGRFEGEPKRDICRCTKWVEDANCTIGLAHHALVIFICSAMYYGYIVRTMLYDNLVQAVTGGDTGDGICQPVLPTIIHRNAPAIRSIDASHFTAGFKTTFWSS